LVAALDRLVGRTGVPISITVDHGTELTSKALEEWAYQHGVKLDFTHPGEPTENGHIESFNDRLRDLHSAHRRRPVSCGKPMGDAEQIKDLTL